VVIVMAGLLVAGCSPSDIVAVTLSERGMPVVVDCGTYIVDVQVFDAESGRLVWSAAERSGSSGPGVGEVEVGVLPRTDWMERSSLRLDPSPSSWRVLVPRPDSGDVVTMEFSTAQLATDRVLIAGSGKSVSRAEFRDRTCGYGPSSGSAALLWLMLTLGVAVVVVLVPVVVVAAWWVRRRKAIAPPEGGEAPPGWYPESAVPGAVRWWDGREWTEHRATYRDDGG
jgi:hypothetical protein